MKPDRRTRKEVEEEEEEGRSTFTLNGWDRAGKRKTETLQEEKHPAFWSTFHLYTPPHKRRYIMA